MVRQDDECSLGFYLPKNQDSLHLKFAWVRRSTLGNLAGQSMDHESIPVESVEIIGLSIAEGVELCAGNTCFARIFHGKQR